MSESNEVYTLGFWTALPEKESEFIAAWQEFARWTMQNQKGTIGDAKLIQDVSEPRRFISFGAWQNPERVQEWRRQPEFQSFFLKAKTLCEDIKPGNWKEAASASA